MSFLDTVLQQVQSMHLPVSSNDVVLAMKDHESMGILSPAARRDKVRKALSDLKNKKHALISWNDDAGILWWELSVLQKAKKQLLPKKEIQQLPEKLPEMPKEDEHKVLRQFLRDVGHSFLKAADAL